jgi:hypothetical protein
MVAFVAGLIVLARGGIQADTLYGVRPIVELGDRIGDAQIRIDTGIWVGTLNDKGHIAFVTRSAAGSPTLVHYADGRFRPIVVAGQDGPIGKWPPFVVLWSPVSMDPRGNVVFSLRDQEAGTTLGTFLWDSGTEQITPVALRGMPAPNNQTFVYGGGPTPVINSRGEIALVAGIRNTAGEARDGVFFLGHDGKLQPVVLPDDELPGGGQVQAAWGPSLNDVGAVAFLAVRQGDEGASAYLWQKSELLLVAAAGMEAPDKEQLVGVWDVRVNNKNRSVLVEAILKSPARTRALYRFADGNLTPIAVPGQTMPGGGTLSTVEGGVSAANDAGQHVFLARLVGGATAAYLMNSDGKVSLVVKSSPRDELGQITRVGEANSFGVGLNNKGQVALAVKIAGITGSVLVLLTPSVP